MHILQHIPSSVIALGGGLLMGTAVWLGYSIVQLAIKSRRQANAQARLDAAYGRKTFHKRGIFSRS